MNLSEPGLGDFILMEDITEENFMENLKTRFEKDRIYVRLFFFPFFIFLFYFLFIFLTKIISHPYVHLMKH